MSILRDAINAADPTPDKKKELTLALGLLSELAATRVREFETRVIDDHRRADEENSQSIPITKRSAQFKRSFAYVKSNASTLPDQVTDAVRDFVTGGTNEIITGIGKLVTTGLEAIMGAGEGQEDQMESTFVVVTKFGISRYDICAWSRSIEASGITQYIEKTIAIYACQSGVNVSKLDFNLFLILYGDQLVRMGLSETEYDDYMVEAEKMYVKLGGKVGETMGNGGVATMRSLGELVYPLH